MFYLVFIDLKRAKRDATQILLPISATVELVLVVDYSIWKKVGSREIRGAKLSDSLTELLLYFAHMTQIVSKHIHVYVSCIACALDPLLHCLLHYVHVCGNS